MSANGAPDEFLNAIGRLGPALLHGLAALEHAQRHMHPPGWEALRETLRPRQEALAEASAAFSATPAPAELGAMARQLQAAVQAASNALEALVAPADEGDAIGRVLGAFRTHCRAQEALYPLRRALPPVGGYFAEAWRHDHAALDPENGLAVGLPVGLHNASNGMEQRGGFALYVPEWYTEERRWPLVMALHGGMGHGADFLWSWLREARSRGFLLLAPTSRGSTWSLDAPPLDGRALDSMLDYVCERWQVDERAMLLTGLSDGATFTWLHGLSEASRFSALAPVSGVFHPLNYGAGNLERAAGRRVYLVHGALDWMFPASLAESAAAELREAGADLTLEIVPDLSHTCPREKNAAILDWFDERLRPERVMREAPGGAP